VQYTDSELKALMSENRGWFGFPPRAWRGTVIDGRRRSALATSLGITVPPAVAVRSAAEAARWLALQGHDERALALVDAHLGGELPVRLPAEVAARLDGVRRAEHKRNAKRRLDSQRRNRRDATRDVIRRLKALLEVAEETGDPVSVTDLRMVLGTWGAE